MTAEAYLVVANPSSKNNLGTLIRCAAAFAAEEVIVVGAAKWSTHGAHGSNKHVTYRWFSDWTLAAKFLRTERGCDLCGVVSPGARTVSPASADTPAIVAPDYAGKACLARAEEFACGSHAASAKPEGEDALRSSASSEAANQQKKSDVGNLGQASRTSTAVRHRPFRRSTAFLVGHRNRLAEEALELCDLLVHVEQVGAPSGCSPTQLSSTALVVVAPFYHSREAKESPVELEPPVTTAIALHHFTAWARYKERTFKGEKFQVDEQPVRCQPPADKITRKEERMRAREELQAADPLITDDGDDERCDTGLGWLEEVEGDREDGGDY